MKEWKRLLNYIYKYRIQAALNISFNVLAILFSLFSVVMIIPFLQLLFGKIPPVLERPDFIFSSAWFIEMCKYLLSRLIQTQGETYALGIICVFVAIVFFLKNIFRFLAVYALAPIRNGVVKDIRNELYAKILRLPLSFFNRERKGEIITRMTEDVKEIEWSVMSFIEITVREPVTILVNLGFMIFLSPELTLFVLAMLGITGLIIGRIGRSLKKESGDAQKQSAGMISMVEETLSGIRIIQAFSAEKFQMNRFSEYNNEAFNISNRMLIRRDLSSPLTEFLAICVVCLVLWFGGNLVLQEKMLEAETFIGFMVIFSQLIPPSKNFSNAFYHLQRGMASSTRIHQLLDEPEPLKDSPLAIVKNTFERRIEFKHVSQCYTDGKWVLQDINLTLEKGKMIALVGPSGAGKSTLADLLPRFYNPSSGEIQIDGVSTQQIDTNSLRNLIGIVSQEPILFNDTIFNNVSFGQTGYNEKDVVEACKAAHAHEFILKLKKGYDTYIGDRGNLLSGGERQRLTIARAILKNPPILILDEATSSLDAESEKLVQDALLKLTKGRTTLIIAHRLSTVQHADEIIVLQNGRITEKGTHSLLLQNNGLYARMVELQSF